MQHEFSMAGEEEGFRSGGEKMNMAWRPRENGIASGACLDFVLLARLAVSSETTVHAWKGVKLRLEPRASVRENFMGRASER